MTQFNTQNNFLISRDKQPIKAAVFTAHPDDETVWMGGTILSKNNWNWKIFVATCNASDNRGKEFIKAMEKYREYGEKNLDFEFINVMPDTQKDCDIDEYTAYNKLDQINLHDYDIIFTHNIDGEYQPAPNHKLLGEYFKNKKNSELNIWHFLCPAIQNPRKKEIGKYIESIYLETKLLEQKLLIFNHSYSSQNYLWKDFKDFMRFQFDSGLEIFTHY